ncbi:hypothetical protein OPQ81_004918 [Rhizoctonia solani]|nr:hypothetical protein OPQ81_004918 [Rhizoctonia solani]
MNAIEKLTGQGQSQRQQSGGEGGLTDKVDNALGGGQRGEQNENLLDKGAGFVQERMGTGNQSSESAAERAKDKTISDSLRDGYEHTSGSDFPAPV